MRGLSTSACCCCANLRTGGLIIGFLSLIDGAFYLLLFGVAGLLPSVIGILIDIAWLYGIYKHKTNWMLPALVLAIFFLIMWVCSLILLPIFGLVAREQIQEIIDEAAGGARVESMDSTTFLIVSWVFAAIATVIRWHFTSVMYSLHKYMKGHGRSTNVA